MLKWGQDGDTDDRSERDHGPKEWAAWMGKLGQQALAHQHGQRKKEGTEALWAKPLSDVC